MDANNIKYIVAIAKYGSINHAAKAMFISQPQLSHILKTTEEECGLTLFQRTSRGTKLTPEGEDYLHHCNIILAEMAKLNRYVTQAASAQSQHDPLFAHLRVFQRNLPPPPGRCHDSLSPV